MQDCMAQAGIIMMHHDCSNQALGEKLLQLDKVSHRDMLGCVSAWQNLSPCHSGCDTAQAYRRAKQMQKVMHLHGGPVSS